MNPAALMLAIANVIAPPAPLHLVWNLCTDPSVVSYDVQATAELVPANWVSLTNTTQTNYLIWPTQPHQFYRVLSVDTNGLNSQGYYEPQ